MKIEEFAEAATLMNLDNAGVADLLGVRVETVFKWMRGSKKIPDHYSNLMQNALRERDQAEC